MGLSYGISKNDLDGLGLQFFLNKTNFITQNVIILGKKSPTISYENWLYKKIFYIIQKVKN